MEEVDDPETMAEVLDPETTMTRATTLVLPGKGNVITPVFVEIQSHGRVPNKCPPSPDSELEQCYFSLTDKGLASVRVWLFSMFPFGTISYNNDRLVKEISHAFEKFSKQEFSSPEEAELQISMFQTEMRALILKSMPNDVMVELDEIAEKILNPKTKPTELIELKTKFVDLYIYCLLYTSPSPRDRQKSRMPSSA